MSGVQVEPKAVDLVIQFEESGSFAPHPQRDPVGNWEIGYGSIWDWRNDPPTYVNESTPPVDEATARNWLGRELTRAAQTVASAVKVPLTHDETAALEDFIYNVGAGNFLSSTLLRMLNAGDYEGAAAQFARWNRASGQVLAGLVRRRAAETDLFKTPDDPQENAS